MTKKEEALRIAARFLTAGYFGKPFTRQDMKTIADLCWISLPMKYRMPKDELDQLRTCEDSIMACGRETDHKQVDGTKFCRCTHVMYD